MYQMLMLLYYFIEFKFLMMTDGMIFDEVKTEHVDVDHENCYDDDMMKIENFYSDSDLLQVVQLDGVLVDHKN